MAETKEKTTTLELTKWEHSQLKEILNEMNVAKAPLGVLAEMMALKSLLDVIEFSEEQQVVPVDLTEVQKVHVHRILTNPNIEWPLSDEAVSFAEKILALA